jgi:tetratricopeptide (TPR) repeat protein
MATYDSDNNSWRSFDGSIHYSEWEAHLADMGAGKDSSSSSKPNSSSIEDDLHEQARRSELSLAYEQERDRRNKYLDELGYKVLGSLKKTADEGAKYFNDRKYELAAVTFQKFLDYITSSNWEKSVKEYKEEIDYDKFTKEEGAPDRIDQWKKSIPTICESLQIAYVRWADELSQKNDFEGAISAYTKGIELGGKGIGAAYFFRGICYSNNKKIIPGINDLKKGADYGDERAIKYLKDGGISYTPQKLPLPEWKYTSEWKYYK